MTPKLVIFDCDGVLVDSEPLSNIVMRDSLARYGLPLTLDACMAHFVGTSMTGCRAKAQLLGAILPANWIAEIYAETYAALRKGVPVIPGIPALLDQLQGAKIPFCVASNGSIEKMQITLGQNGLLDRFENAIFSAQSLGVSKPDPDLFLIAAARLNTTPPDCVVIEDSPGGALAAARAGMRCFGFAPENQGQSLAAHGAHLFHNMSDLPALLSL